MERDLKALSPKERLLMLEKLMQYVIPKQKTEIEIKEIQNGKEKEVEEPFDWSCVPDELICKMAEYIQDAQYKKRLKCPNRSATFFMYGSKSRP